MPRFVGCVSVHLKVHRKVVRLLLLVAAIGREVLQPEGLHAVDGPRVVLAGQEDGIKVQPLLHNQARDDARLVGGAIGEVDAPLAVVDVVDVGGGVRLLLLGARFGRSALIAERRALRLVRGPELRERQIGHVAHDRRCAVARLPVEVVEPLAAGAEVVVLRDHHGHPHGRLLGHGLGRARDEVLQVVRGAVHERLPRRPPVGGGDQLDGRALHHDDGRRAAAEVDLGLQRALAVQRAGDARVAQRLGSVLARFGAVEAHAALAAEAIRRLEARLADVLVQAQARHRHRKEGYPFGCGPPPRRNSC